MKEIIARRNKKRPLLLLIISLIFLIIGFILLFFPLFFKLALLTTILFTISCAVWLFFYLDKRGVIFRENESLYIFIGLIKKRVYIKDITEVSLVSISKKKEKYEKGTVFIKTIADEKERSIYVTEIINDCETVEKIKSLIKEFNS